MVSEETKNLIKQIDAHNKWVKELYEVDKDYEEMKHITDEAVMNLLEYMSVALSQYA